MRLPADGLGDAGSEKRDEPAGPARGPGDPNEDRLLPPSPPMYLDGLLEGEKEAPDVLAPSAGLPLPERGELL